MKMKQFAHLLIMSCLLPALALAAPPKPPAGKQWKQIGNMSDEFSGNSLDTSKWDCANSPWRGRKPGLFRAEAVTVSGGKLQITADELANPNSTWSHQGGIVRSNHRATYGYFEARMKANKTFMSSTFWLINHIGDASGCDKRITELDITETVGFNSGRQSWINNNMHRMNSNTHSRNTSCSGTPTGRKGDGVDLGELSSAGYHTYGLWWKSAKELLFYLDDRFVYSITPPANFNLGMYLRMVVETYDWNPVPPDGGMKGSFQDRTTYYDWVRSYKLEDAGIPPQPSPDPSGQQLPWDETFDHADGTTSDGGPTGWTASRNKGVFDVSANRFHITNPSGEGVLTSDYIDVSDTASVDFSVEVDGTGTTKEPADYVRIYYILDDGGEQLIDALTDDFNPTLVTTTVDTSNADNLRIVFRSAVSWTGEHYYWDNVTVTASQIADAQPPTPNPATWSVHPEATGSDAITMTATAGSDASGGVAYFFEETSGNPGGSDSGWQTSASYTDTGLSTGTTYTYSVKIRDALENVGSASSTASATTEPEDTGRQSLPWQETFDQADGATADENPNGWTSSRNKGIFEVSNNRFHINGARGEGVWNSGDIDVSSASSVEITVDVDGTGTTKEPADYVRVYYTLDGGSEQLVDALTDDFNPTLVSTNVDTGGADNLSIVIRSAVSTGTEHYYWDNVSVIAQGPVLENATHQAEDFTDGPGYYVSSLNAGYTGTGYRDMDGNGSWFE